MKNSDGRKRSLKSTVSALCLPALLAFVAAYLLPGCLILAERPNNEIGEECSSSKHCPDYGHCEFLSGEDSAGTCLPDNVECTQRVSPQCQGYICEIEHSYCHRSCRSASDCVDGYSCDYDYSALKGECVPEEVPQDECSSSDTSACAGYSCHELGFCRSICFDVEDCAAGYGCSDDNDCIPR